MYRLLPCKRYILDDLLGSTWREHRRLLNPCFATRIIADYVPLVNEGVHTMVHRLRRQAAGKEEHFDIYPYVEACTLDTYFRE